MKSLIVLVFVLVGLGANAEENKFTCSCKCVMNWLSTSLDIAPADVGLPESASRSDVMARSGLACRNYCEQSERDRFGDVMYFGYRSGMCR